MTTVVLALFRALHMLGSSSSALTFGGLLATAAVSVLGVGIVK